MAQGMNSQEARKFLPAFADGELDVEQNLRVLEQMAMDPTNTKRVMHQQQLRRACARVMDDPELRCPEALREQIAALAEDTPQHGPADAGADSRSADETNSGGGGVLATIGRWAAPLGVAAALLIAGLVFLQTTDPTDRGYTADGLISASLAQSFGERHVQCALGEQPPYQSELFPAELDGLDQALVQHVGQDLEGAALDLTSLGYDYEIAGFCPIPGGQSVHVIYQNPEGKALSLWIKPYDAQPTLDPGVPYVPPHAHGGRPMMVWREGDMVFFLVGDVMEDVRDAQPAIHLATRA